MDTPGQWLHQHDFLFLGTTIYATAALLMIWRHAGRRWWVTWAAGLSPFIASIVLLRTPDVTLTTPGDAPGVISFEQPVLPPGANLPETVRSLGTPVLAEIYADYGLS
jgi:hypothetical protein